MMNGSGDGWDWIWMVPIMIVWIVVIGVVIYAAVRLALHDDRRTRRDHRA